MEAQTAIILIIVIAFGGSAINSYVVYKQRKKKEQEDVDKLKYIDNIAEGLFTFFIEEEIDQDAVKKRFNDYAVKRKT
jgi:hypothetical protein